VNGGTGNSRIYTFLKKESRHLHQPMGQHMHTHTRIRCCFHWQTHSCVGMRARTQSQPFGRHTMAQCSRIGHSMRWSSYWVSLPFMFGRDLQCQPVRGVNIREGCHWSHARSLQTSMSGNQWHPRVQISVENAHRARILLRISCSLISSP